jgi:hypothetical protein
VDRSRVIRRDHLVLVLEAAGDRGVPRGELLAMVDRVCRDEKFRYEAFF